MVLFDIQDVGVRFYTYISTLTYVMEAGAENNVEVIVLDRPNPHDGYIAVSYTHLDVYKRQDEKFVNHFDICFVNSNNLKFSIERTLVFFGKNGDNAVFQIQMKIRC